MNFDLEKLYALLPAVYRIKDHDFVDDENKVPPLKALFSILAEEIELMEENLDQLYDDQFIETCAEWAIPYIGDLIGFKPLAPIKDPKFTSRSEVANTIGYRRRKGTLSILEQLARDVTNWDANVVEYFKLLATTQYLNHLRPENVAIPHLKNWEQLEYVDTPFDSIPKSADVRNISSKRGKYNIPNIGIYLWRIQALTRTKSTAFKVDNTRFTFHPLGVDTPLFNFPKEEIAITSLATATNMPVKFKRRLLKEHLEEHYGQAKDLLISIDDDREILISEVCIGDLSSWDDPLSPLSNMVVIDPVLGRIMFGDDFMASLTSNDVSVWYNYGSLDQMSGGEYSREATFSNFDSIFTVSKDAGLGDFLTIQEAIDEAQIETENAIVEILDNETYKELLELQLQQGQTIEIRGAEGRCPVLLLTSDLVIEGEALSKVVFNGLIIDGANIIVQDETELDEVSIKHCTLKPDSSINKIVLGAPIKLTIESSIIAGVETFENAVIYIENSIVDATNKEEKAISADEDQRAKLTCKNTTIIGEVDVKSISLVENSIFTSLVTVIMLQKGCVRFSYLPFKSITPRKYNCYPTTLGEATTIVPTFMATIYGDPAYYQLDSLCNEQFLEGADDGSEIGVYHNLYQPQKESNLRIRLNEYLRFGMDAGVFYAS